MIEDPPRASPFGGSSGGSIARSSLVAPNPRYGGLSRYEPGRFLHVSEGSRDGTTFSLRGHRRARRGAVPRVRVCGDVTVTSAPFASPVTLSWTVTATLTETLFRATGACPAGHPRAEWRSRPPSERREIRRVARRSRRCRRPRTASPTRPGDGTFCYYVQDDGVGIGAGGTATVDTVTPTATVAVGYSTVAPFVRGTAVVDHGRRATMQRLPPSSTRARRLRAAPPQPPRSRARGTRRPSPTAPT